MDISHHSLQLVITIFEKIQSICIQPYCVPECVIMHNFTLKKLKLQTLDFLFYFDYIVNIPDFQSSQNFIFNVLSF